MVGLTKNIHDYEKQKLHKWLYERTYDATLAVTLTQSLKKIHAFNGRTNKKLKHYTASTSGTSNSNVHSELNKYELIKSTREVGQQDLRYVRYNLNKELFGNKWYKHNKGLKTTSVIEYTKQGYAHWHLAIRADLKDLTRVTDYINNTWQHTYLGGNENYFELIDDSFGWTGYMSKFGCKAYIDTVNTTN